MKSILALALLFLGLNLSANELEIKENINGQLKALDHYENSCADNYTLANFYGLIALEHRATITEKYKALEAATNQLHKYAIEQSIDDNAYLIIERAQTSIQYYDLVIPNCPSMAKLATDLRAIIDTQLQYARELRSRPN